MCVLSLCRIKEIFQEFDKDQSRGIDEAELKAGMLAMGIKLTDAETKQMLGDADEDNDGYIQLEEFETVVVLLVCLLLVLLLILFCC